MNIECSFGFLVARWGVLWRPLRSALMHNICTIRAVVALHNWCQARHAPVLMSAGGGEHSVPISERPYLSHGEHGVPCYMLAGNSALQGQRTEPHMVSLRRHLATEIELMGMERPCVSVELFFADSLLQQ